MRRIISTLGHSLGSTLGHSLGSTLGHSLGSTLGHSLGSTLGHSLRLSIIPALLVALLGSGAGCNAYRLEPPVGFAQVHSGEYGAHMKANDDVGLRVNVFGNVKGGTLAFWSRDLVEKLAERGYTLEAQSPAESKNGVVGTRFDFTYTPVGKDEPPRFYTAVLFVSDEYRVVVQLAGREEHEARYTAQIDEIVADLKVRGCKLGRKICKGPQPDRLSTPAPASTGEAEGEAETGKTPEKTKAEPEANPEPPKPQTASAVGPADQTPAG